MGDGVNIAARLEGIAKPGAICLSEDAYRQVKGRLDLAVTDLGPTQLKNIAEPMRVYSLEVGAPAQAKPVEAKPIEAQRPRRKRRYASRSLAAIAALLLLVAAGGWYSSAPIGPRPSPRTRLRRSRPQRLSIVVLPFANLSGDPAQDYLADALTDELTTALARIRDSFRHRAQHGLHLQGQAGRRQGDRQGSGRALCAGRLGAAERQSGEGQRPAHRRRQRRTSLGRTIRHPPRRSVADAGRDRHPSGARDELQLTEAEAARLKRTPAANPERRGFGSPVRRGRAKSRSYSARKRKRVTVSANRRSPLDPNNVHALTFLSIKFCVGRGRP